MTQIDIISEMHRELRTHVDDAYKRGNQNFFKEKIRCYGVRTPIVRRIATRYFKKLRHASKRQVFALAEKLLITGYNEDATIAIQWVGACRDDFEKKDFVLFESWLKKYIDNWGKDDDFCLHVLHPLLNHFPEFMPHFKKWTCSKNRWVRRASAVSFITTSGAFYATKHSLDDIFDVATRLLHDDDDLVQKGYGWMLKATSVHHQKEVFDFVMRHKDTMPRTALRYAIEKMPPSLRKRALQ